MSSPAEKVINATPGLDPAEKAFFKAMVVEGIAEKDIMKNLRETIQSPKYTDRLKTDKDNQIQEGIQGFMDNVGTGTTPTEAQLRADLTAVLGPGVLNSGDVEGAKAKVKQMLKDREASTFLRDMNADRYDLLNGRLQPYIDNGIMTQDEANGLIREVRAAQQKLVQDLRTSLDNGATYGDVNRQRAQYNSEVQAEIDTMLREKAQNDPKLKEFANQYMDRVRRAELDAGTGTRFDVDQAIAEIQANARPALDPIEEQVIRDMLQVEGDKAEEIVNLLGGADGLTPEHIDQMVERYEANGSLDHHEAIVLRQALNAVRSKEGMEDIVMITEFFSNIYKTLGETGRTLLVLLLVTGLAGGAGLLTGNILVAAGVGLTGGVVLGVPTALKSARNYAGIWSGHNDKVLDRSTADINRRGKFEELGVGLLAQVSGETPERVKQILQERMITADGGAEKPVLSKQRAEVGNFLQGLKGMQLARA